MFIIISTWEVNKKTHISTFSKNVIDFYFKHLTVRINLNDSHPQVIVYKFFDIKSLYTS